MPDDHPRTTEQAGGGNLFAMQIKEVEESVQYTMKMVEGYLTATCSQFESLGMESQNSQQNK